MIVGERVADVFALTPEGHKMGGAQGGELVGDRGFGHAEQVGEVADTEVGAVERHEQAHTRHITEHLEEVGDGQEEAILRGGRAQGSEERVMMMLLRTERCLRFHGASRQLNF